MSSVTKSVDVAVPVRTAYDQWTQFEEFPRFMKGVRQVRHERRAGSDAHRLQRALAIVAHPDDLEYGAAGAVAVWNEAGRDVAYPLATLTSGGRSI